MQSQTISYDVYFVNDHNKLVFHSSHDTIGKAKIVTSGLAERELRIYSVITKNEILDMAPLKFIARRVKQTIEKELVFHEQNWSYDGMADQKVIWG